MHTKKVKFYSNDSRFWELDFFRGLAIVSMIMLHSIWAMDYFDITAITFYDSVIFIASRTTAFTFLLLVGICLTISYSKTKEDVLKKYFSRGLKLILLGIVITFVSFFLPKGGTVVFGILHLIGLSIILSLPFLNKNRGWINLLTGFIFIIIGLILTTITVNSKWLIWLGLTFPGFYTIDYFPLFPWLGAVLIGIFLGNFFYANGKRKFNIKNSPNLLEEFFCLLGRHSLAIYFLHMIVILSIVYLLV